MRFDKYENDCTGCASVRAPLSRRGEEILREHGILPRLRCGGRRVAVYPNTSIDYPESWIYRQGNSGLFSPIQERLINREPWRTRPGRGEWKGKEMGEGARVDLTMNDVF